MSEIIRNRAIPISGFVVASAVRPVSFDVGKQAADVNLDARRDVSEWY
jgi:hypothetical protein